jgi:hypothetical protein
MKNVVLWDTENQFVPHRKHITFPLQRPACYWYKIWCFHCGDYEECRLLGYEKTSSYLTGNTLRLRYRVQPVNDIRFDVFTVVTMKNAVFWDIEHQFVSHRKHIKSPLQILIYDLMFLCGEYEERRFVACDAVWHLLEQTFRRPHRLHHQSGKNNQTELTKH